MSLILYPPKSWDEFQYLCHDLWRLIWNDPNTQLNGRQGHTQYGVDVFGLPYYASAFHGVQCKGRNGNYNSRLTIPEVNAECKDAADNFRPGLESLVVATTSPRDPKVQEHCRQMTSSHTYPFKVSVWSWDDIEEEIPYRPELMSKYYPTVKPDYVPDSIVLDYTSIEDKVHAFFSRPNMRSAISYDYRHYLFAIVTELADNAFSKGKAGKVKIEFKDSSLIIVDDGAPFNPEDLLKNEGRGGKYTLNQLIGLFDGDMQLNYNYDCQNEFTMIFPKGVLSQLINEDFKITLNDTKFFGRSYAHRLALLQFANIPQEKKRIKVFVDTEYGLAMSNASEYFETALQSLNEGQFIEVLYTENSGDAEHLNELFQGRPISFKSW